MVDRAGQPEMEAMVLELREAAKQRLWNKSSCFTAIAGGAGSSDLLPEADFRRGLKAAMAEFWAIPGSMPEDDEDRLVLLAEKDAEGRVLWRAFVQSFCGLELDQMSEITEEPPTSPSIKGKGRTPGGLQTGTASVGVAGAGPSGISQQSWRKQPAKIEGRSVVTNKGQADPPLSPQAQKRGYCCLRRRS